MVRAGFAGNLESNKLLKIERIWRDGEEGSGNPRKMRVETVGTHMTVQ